MTSMFPPPVQVDSRHCPDGHFPGGDPRRLRVAGYPQRRLRAARVNPGTLAKVGDEPVTERELSVVMQRRLNELRQQNPEADYSAWPGDFPNILDSLIQSRAMTGLRARP